MSADSYEAVCRVEGSFAQFRRGMELLRDRKVPFVVKSALLPPNRHEMDKFESWAAEIPWMDAPPGYAIFFEKRCRQDNPEKDRQIQALRLSPEEALAVKTRDPQQYRKAMSDFCQKVSRAAKRRVVRLRRGQRTAAWVLYGRFAAVPEPYVPRS